MHVRRNHLISTRGVQEVWELHGPGVEVADELARAVGGGLEVDVGGKGRGEEGSHVAAAVGVAEADAAWDLNEDVGEEHVGVFDFEFKGNGHPVWGGEDGGPVEDHGEVGVGHAHGFEHGEGAASAVVGPAQGNDVSGAQEVLPDARCRGSRKDFIQTQDDGDEDLFFAWDGVCCESAEGLSLAVQAQGVPAIGIDQDGRILMDGGIARHGGSTDRQSQGGFDGTLSQSGQMGDPRDFGAVGAGAMIQLDKVGDEGCIQGFGDHASRTVQGGDLFLMAADGLDGLFGLRFIPLAVGSFPPLRDQGQRRRVIGNTMGRRRRLADDEVSNTSSSGNGWLLDDFFFDLWNSGGCRGISLFSLPGLRHSIRHVDDDGALNGTRTPEPQASALLADFGSLIALQAAWGGASITVLNPRTGRGDALCTYLDSSFSALLAST